MQISVLTDSNLGNPYLLNMSIFTYKYKKIQTGNFTCLLNYPQVTPVVTIVSLLRSKDKFTL